MPKPFSLQAPEDIAKEYGGNKQKIAQAMQTGLVDPTAGTLAGMFIDRMRSAQMQEGAQQPSVAQQVFAPPAPPAPPMGGMGPPPGAPPMGAPPMGGMPPAPPMGAPPMGAPPMGMADGGLAMLPVPDNMFGEPMDGGYANGGIVAFAMGSPGEIQQTPEDEEQEVVARREPEQYHGFYRDPRKNMEAIQQLYKPERKYTDKANAFYEEVLSPEGQKQRRNENKYLALAEGFFTMANTPGSVLQAASAGAKAALPGLKSASKELRAETRDAIKQLALSEGESNKQALEFAKMGIEGQGKYADAAEAAAKRIADANIAFIQEKGALERARISAGAGIRAAQIGANATASTNPLKMVIDIQQTAQAEAQEAVQAWRENQPSYTPTMAKNLDAQANALYNAEYQKRIAAFAQSSPMLASMLGVAPGAGGTSGGMSYGSPPPGAVQLVRPPK